MSFPFIREGVQYGSLLEQLMAADGLDTGFGSVSEAGWRAFVREVATRVIFMDKGRIVETGSPADIFERPQTDRLRDFAAKILRH